MRKLLFICMILQAFAVAVGAQSFSQTDDSENLSPSEKAEKFDEFGSLPECELGARVDSFILRLHNNPGSTGYMIFYKGKDILPARLNSNFNERLTRDYIRLRRFDPSRVVFVSGGFHENSATEFWIVPPGVEPPVPTDTMAKPEIPVNTTFLFDRSYLFDDDEIDFSDEFILPSVKAQEEAERLALEESESNEADFESKETDEETPFETEMTDAEDEESEQLTPEEIEAQKFSWISEKFGELIRNRKESSGVIIFYADELRYDIGRLLNHIEEGKRKIAGAAKISPDKIQVLFGGYRTGIEAEFYIVPKNGEFPAAAPEERPVEEIETEENQEVSR